MFKICAPLIIVLLSLLAMACSAPAPAPAVAPVAPSPASVDGSESENPVVAAYRAFVIEQCDALVLAAKDFVSAIHQGDLATARARYAPSRMFFERIEPIAEALGDFDPRIDAREGDVPTAQWTGYHVLEKALWAPDALRSGARLDAASLAIADTLVADIKLLRAKIETARISVSAMVTGAVELLNEVSATKVTGEEERYSHTDLYDFAANVQGAAEIYRLLRAMAVQYDAELAKRIDRAFENLDKALAAHAVDKGYVLYTSLTSDQVKTLSQAVDALAEPLSQLGSLAGI